MVMATKLDNLTVDSSSSSFSACATLEQIATTTTATTTNNNTTANNNLIKQMQRLNLTSLTTNTTTIITTPTLVATAQSSSLLSAHTSLSSSQSQSPSPSLLNNDNATTSISANSTHIFYPNAKQYATNTYANLCTLQNLQTNALTHAIAGRNALPPLNTNNSPQTLVAHDPVGNINNTVESFLYLNKFTNHFLAIKQNHTTTINNKITYNNDNNNKLSLNTNATIRCAMSNLKTPESSNASMLKCDYICNNFNILNKPLEYVNFHSNSNRLLDCSSKLTISCCGI